MKSGRPRTSTLDKWLAEFTGWAYYDRDFALRQLELIHKTATILERKKQAETKDSI